MSRLIRFSFASVLVAAALVTPAHAAAADKPDRADRTGTHAKHGKQLRIVQLGDSYSAGNGAGSYVEKDCWRSSASYGAQVAARLGATYDNVACSGGVVKDLREARALSGPQPKTATYVINPVFHPNQEAAWKRTARWQRLCGTPAQRDMYYLYDVSDFSATGNQVTATASCQLMTKPQIDAVRPWTDLVFVTIGGNDIGFSNIVVQCLVARQPLGCESALDAARAKIAQMKDETKAALLAVYRRSWGNADIYLLGYPFLINTDDYSIPEAAPVYNAGAALHEVQLQGDQAQAQGMAELNARAWWGDDFHFVDVKPAWGGHTHGLDPHVVADQSQSWIVPPFAPGRDIPEWAHPALDGWTATAAALYDALTN